MFRNLDFILNICRKDSHVGLSVIVRIDSKIIGSRCTVSVYTDSIYKPNWTGRQEAFIVILRLVKEAIEAIGVITRVDILHAGDNRVSNAAG